MGGWVRLRNTKELGEIADHTAFAEGYAGNGVIVEIGGERRIVPKSALSSEAHRQLNTSLRGDGNGRLPSVQR